MDEARKPGPAIKSRFISHGTLSSRDLEKSRRFYEQFLGLEVVRTSPISLMVRLGGEHVYAVVENKRKDRPMDRYYHNGIDVESDADVDEAWRICTEQAQKWGLHEIGRPSARQVPMPPATATASMPRSRSLAAQSPPISKPQAQ